VPAHQSVSNPSIETVRPGAWPVVAAASDWVSTVEGCASAVGVAGVSP